MVVCTVTPGSGSPHHLAFFTHCHYLIFPPYPSLLPTQRPPLTTSSCFMDNQDNDLAAAAAAALDAPQFHHPLQQPDFSHHHLDPNKIEEVHVDHQHHHEDDQHHDLDVQLDIPDDVNDDLNLDLGMHTPNHDVDLDMGSDFRRPPTIRKGMFICRQVGSS